MPQQKKQVATQQAKKKWNWRVTLAAIAVGTLVGTVAVLVIDKFRIHTVVCQIAGFDAENGVVGAKCMIK